MEIIEFTPNSLSKLFFYASQDLSEIGLKLIFDLATCLNGLFWPFLFCKSATMATHAISNVGNTVYNSSWYRYPPNKRRYLIPIMARSQKMVYLTGMGLVQCWLETYLKVNFKIGLVENIILLTDSDLFQFNQSAVSFYLMFRNLSLLQK